MDATSEELYLDLEGLPEESLTKEECREYQIYKQLLALSPKLEERLYNGSEQDVYHIAAMVSKGSANACSDDTRALKAAVVDWITPRGGVLIPPLQRNIKADRGFHHNRTGGTIMPCYNGLAGQQCSRTATLRRDHKYDPEDPLEGLLRAPFLSTSVERTDNRATRCSNSKIHGMSTMTIPSLAYVATQVRFALTSTATFSRTDTITDSEKFYNSLITLLEDPEEQSEVKMLLRWWDSQIFPMVTVERSLSSSKDSVYAKIKEKRLKESQTRMIEGQGDSQGRSRHTSPRRSPELTPNSVGC
ncbi:hypothetical protein BKA70DRAFT_1451784 [Coprinopsis sp. MPI-PUGE-AT-0042]|nr:hypothetical protein BKA70DRAFT_1451784 [Coprinopsis sp. MPI-PUGE-AT-0042]